MTLLRRRKPQRMGMRDAPQIRCPGHLKWLRGFPCAIAGQHLCGGRIEAAHVRAGTDGGMGVKPSDRYAIPLCGDAHAMQHRVGEHQFERTFDISMRKIADDLWRRSPHRLKVEA